jgi:hypothetical protein
VRDEWTVQKGFETAKRAQATGRSSTSTAGWGTRPSPTTLAKCHEYPPESENRSLLERAARVLGLLRQQGGGATDAV